MNGKLVLLIPHAQMALDSNDDRALYLEKYISL